MIKKFEEYHSINENKDEEINSLMKKVSNSLKKFVKNKGGKYDKDYIPVSGTGLAKIVDDGIEKVLKSYPDLKSLWSLSWPNYNSGYGGIRETVNRKIVNKTNNGDDINFEFGWNSSTHFQENEMPYPLNLFFHIGGNVRISVSCAVPGVSWDPITKTSPVDVEKIKTELSKYILNNLKDAVYQSKTEPFL